MDSQEENLLSKLMDYVDELDPMIFNQVDCVCLHEGQFEQFYNPRTETVDTFTVNWRW